MLICVGAFHHPLRGMDSEATLNFLKILQFDRKILLFLVWVSFGLGFSMSIILSTIGLMEGFELGLLSSLNKTNGDFSISHNFTKLELSNLTSKLKTSYKSITSVGMHKSEVFLVGKNKQSKGAVILAGESKNEKNPILVNFKKYHPSRGKLIIGVDLANELRVNVGDQVNALLSTKGSGFLIKRFEVSDTFKTNLYEKDSRLAIGNIEDFSTLDEQNFNFAVFSFNYPGENFDLQKARFDSLNEKLVTIDPNLYAQPYWEDYSTLIEAVEIEKNSILIILQVIVLVSVFNLISFLIFFREKKITELFTLHAMGLSSSKIAILWYQLSSLLWLCAIVISIFLVNIFGVLLGVLSETTMPKSVYHLGKITIHLSSLNYFMVYALSLCWILLMTFFLIRRFKSDSLLRGLRRQYS